MKKNKVLMPKFQIVNKKDGVDKLKETNFPVVAKPFDQGSSIGVSICNNFDELKNSIKEIFLISNKAIIEEYIVGTEVSCGIIGNNRLTILPVAEIVPKNKFFDYQAKYDPDYCQEIIPARLPDEILGKIQSIAKKVYILVGSKGFARIDMIVTKDDIYLLEINTLPGLTKNSILPKEAKAARIDYPELLNQLIELGRKNKYH